jgi:multisubunit Na+/H+ antiporter MnhC subunit
MGADPVSGKGGRTAADHVADEAEVERHAEQESTAEAKRRAAELKAEQRARKAEEKEREKARREEARIRAEEERAAREAAEIAAREEAARAAAERAVAGATASSFDTAAVLREVAKPRLTGSHGAAEVGGTIRACFEALGYEVNGRSFRFNPWPGRYGLTLVGVLYLAGTTTAAALLYRDNPFGAVAMLLILLVVAGLVGLFVRPAIDALRWGSIEGENMLAHRPGARPRYVIMAHRDSKSQPVPLAFRGPAIVLAAVAWLALLVGALAHTARPLPGALILVLAVIAAVSALVLILCWVDNRSPGALDNASGVVAAIAIAARERDADDVAFLITDGEELGLAGARAAAPHLPPVFGVINMDGLDDHGPFYVLERFGLVRKKGLAPHLAAALLEEADARSEPANRRDLPFGIPVDHIPLVKAGIPALTLMRGSIKSLNRVHRPADDLGSLKGDGIRRTTDLVTGALTRLRTQARALER